MEKYLVLVGVVMLLRCCQGGTTGAACAAVLGIGTVLHVRAPYPTCAADCAELIWAGGIDWPHKECLGVAGAPLPLAVGVFIRCDSSCDQVVPPDVVLTGIPCQVI